MTDLAHGAASRPGGLWALGSLGLLLMVGAAGCSSTAASGSVGTTTPEAVSEETTPAVEPAAVAEVEPPPDPQPPTEEPATLAEALNRAGVHTITSTGSGREGEWGTDVSALAFGDRRSATFCMAEDGEPRCWEMPFAPRYTTTITITRGDRDLVARMSLGDPDGSYVLLEATARSVTLTRKRTGQPDEALPAPSERDVPELVRQVGWLELVMAGNTLVARIDDEVQLCERGAEGFVCTDSELISLFQSDGVLSVVSVLADFPGVIGIEYTWREQDGDVYTDGEAIVFVRPVEPTFQQLAHVYVGFSRTARVRLESDDLEIVELDNFEVEQRQPGCLHVGAPTVRRMVERADGRTGTLRPARLRRAPDTVPPDGLDPLTFSMAGAWAFEPAGGLRRIASCDYEDEEEDGD